MITKKPGPMALFAAILMLISSCSKSPVEQSNPHPERKSSTHFAFWNGYNFFSATGDHYSNVFQKYPSPDPAEQELMELSYYTSYGLSKIIASHSNGRILREDLAREIKAHDNLLFAQDFFASHSQYLSAMNSIIQADFGISFSSLFRPVMAYGKEQRIALGFPAYAAPLGPINSNPVIAFTAELPQPDSTTLVRKDEELGPDYYDDDDFIPCFHPNSTEAFPEYSEAMVGFDDYYADSSQFKRERDKWIIVVIPVASKIGSGGKVEGDIEESFTENQVGGNNLPDRGPGCEKASSLELQNLIIKNRYQRFGKSRIRLKLNVQHQAYPGTFQFDLLDGTKRGGVLKIANLKKSEIPANFLSLPYVFGGVDFTNPNFVNSPNPRTDYTPVGFSFFPCLYEHDWYSFMAMKKKTVYNNTIHRRMATSVNMRKSHDYYALYYVDKFDWCYTTRVSFDKPSKQESDLYAGNK